MDAELFLVAGLGNPGDKYTGTRHNVGFDVIDALAGRNSASAGRVRVDRLDCRALTGRIRVGGKPVLLAKPQTYMNLSGESLKGLAVKHEVPPERVLVVLDEAALKLGILRVRATGSSAGHNGLQSVLDCFKTQAVPRLRIGIAGEHFVPGEDKADYVLARFGKSERTVIDAAIATACDAVEVWVEQGIDAAMSRFNRPNETSTTN